MERSSVTREPAQGPGRRAWLPRGLKEEENLWLQWRVPAVAAGWIPRPPAPGQGPDPNLNFKFK